MIVAFSGKKVFGVSIDGITHDMITRQKKIRKVVVAEKIRIIHFLVTRII